MKRENKAYSYQEQIIELELKEVTAAVTPPLSPLLVGRRPSDPSPDPPSASVGAEEEEGHQR